MAQLETEIDSIRFAAACPEFTLILKPKDSFTPYIVTATGQKGASEWNTEL